MDSFPYHIRRANSSNQLKVDATSRNLSSPILRKPTYMVLDLETEIPKFRKGGALDHNDDNQKMSMSSNRYKTDTQTARQYLKEKAKKELSQNPKLRHSFGLTKLSPKVEDLRNMIGRADVACQTDDNLARHNFPNLTEYQCWSSNEVEPFFRDMKKALKSNRPVDIAAYCIAYCHAMKEGNAEPSTREEEF